MKKNYLSKNDIELLRNWGYCDEDVAQINRAIPKTRYLYCNDMEEKEKVTYKKARELLRHETFLSGISRSAFHWTSIRTSEDDKTIFFDSSKLFEDI